MKFEVCGKLYDVVINRKNNKNIYIRVDNKLNIVVSCNYLTSKNTIEKLLIKNINSISKMINNKEKDNKFFYLGKPYDIIYKEVDKVEISDSSIITKDNDMLNKWLKNEIIRVFDERYVYVFNHYYEDIKSPILKIRNMKTRWGVYNRKNHTITLNSKLIECDIEKIDYVIIHELSHIIHFNHSKEFWNLVSKYEPNYKRIRKEMK